MRRSGFLLSALAAITVIPQCGCQLMPHNLQPEQLWKMNRQPALDVRYVLPDESNLKLVSADTTPATELTVN